MGRTDKKTQFAPYVPIWLKEVVEGIAKQTNLPMGDTARAIVMEAQRHTSIIDRMSVFFWRTLERGDCVWPGRNDNLDIKRLIDFPYDKCERLKFRLTLDDRRLVDDLLMSLACPADNMMAALLITGAQDREIVRLVAPTFQTQSRYAIERRAAKWHGYSVRS